MSPRRSAHDGRDASAGRAPGEARPAVSGARWTDDEDRWLRRHRLDGLAFVAHAMGRSERAVRERARSLGFDVPAEPTLGELCPMCGRRRVTPGTRAAGSGMCLVCWERRKLEVYEQRRDELEAARAYDAAKKRARRRSR